MSAVSRRSPIGRVDVLERVEVAVVDVQILGAQLGVAFMSAEPPFDVVARARVPGAS